MTTEGLTENITRWAKATLFFSGIVIVSAFGILWCVGGPVAAFVFSTIVGVYGIYISFKELQKSNKTLQERMKDYA